MNKKKLPDSIRMITIGMVRWARNVACIGEITTPDKFLERNTVGESFGTLTNRWNVNI
jgi:hypothetical protein